MKKQLLVLNRYLQRQSKLILSERPFKMLHNETKIINIRQAVLKIFNFEDQDLDSFLRTKDRKPKMLFLDILCKLKTQ